MLPSTAGCRDNSLPKEEKLSRYTALAPLSHADADTQSFCTSSLRLFRILFLLLFLPPSFLKQASCSFLLQNVDGHPDDIPLGRTDVLANTTRDEEDPEDQDGTKAKSHQPRESLPRFPKKPDSMLNAEEVDLRLKQLEEYLNFILQCEAYKNHYETVRELSDNHQLIEVANLMEHKRAKFPAEFSNLSRREVQFPPETFLNKTK